MVSMPEVETIWKQLRELAIQEYRGERRVRRIRVTRYAIPGSITILPVTKERARTLPPVDWAYDPRLSEEPLEILMHYEDWRGLLRSKDSIPYLNGAPVAHTRLLGIQVVIDH